MFDGGLAGQQSSQDSRPSISDSYGPNSSVPLLQRYQTRTKPQIGVSKLAVCHVGEKDSDLGLELSSKVAFVQ